MASQSQTTTESTVDGRSREELQARSVLLTRTSAYRLIPTSVRRLVDRAILLRPEGCATLEAVDRKYRLNERFGVTQASLKTYARRLEQLVQPIFAGHLLATILGALPVTYRRQLTQGSQILLLSRAVSAMTSTKHQMTNAELAKLASCLASENRSANPIGSRKRGSGLGGKHTRQNDVARKVPTAGNPAELEEAVRMVYGLEWPSTEDAPRGRHQERRATGENDAPRVE